MHPDPHIRLGQRLKQARADFPAPPETRDFTPEENAEIARVMGKMPDWPDWSDDPRPRLSPIPWLFAGILIGLILMAAVVVVHADPVGGIAATVARAEAMPKEW